MSYPGVPEGPGGQISSRHTLKNLPGCPRSKQPGIFTRCHVMPKSMISARSHCGCLSAEVGRRRPRASLAGRFSSRHPSPSVIARRNRASSRRSHAAPKSVIFADIHHGALSGEVGNDLPWHLGRTDRPDFVSKSLSGCPRMEKPGIFTAEPRNAEIRNVGTLSLRWPLGGSGDVASPGIPYRPTGRIASRPPSRDLPKCPRSEEPGIFMPEPRDATFHHFGMLSP